MRAAQACDFFWWPALYILPKRYIRCIALPAAGKVTHSLRNEGLKALLHTRTPNHREQYQLCAVLQAGVATTSAHSGDFQMAKFHNFFKQIKILLSKVKTGFQKTIVF